MGKLVVTIRPGGEVETLLKDKVFDTRVLGDRKIERLSEILPTNDGRLFYVKWLAGPYCFDPRPCKSLGVGYFNTYEDAVEYEVKTVNNLRLQGYSFAQRTKEQSNA